MFWVLEPEVRNWVMFVNISTWSDSLPTANKNICHASGIYREMLSNTWK